MHHIARKLIDEMEGDNGCTFHVTPEQERELNQLCNVLPLLTNKEIETLAAGEQSEAEAIAARTPQLTRLHQLLNEIFDQGA